MARAGSGTKLGHGSRVILENIDYNKKRKKKNVLLPYGPEIVFFTYACKPKNKRIFRLKISYYLKLAILAKFLPLELYFITRNCDWEKRCQNCEI